MGGLALAPRACVERNYGFKDSQGRRPGNGTQERCSGTIQDCQDALVTLIRGVGGPGMELLYDVRLDIAKHSLEVERC
eukprot:9470377-Pyramimonas_sp.AAC.1